MLCLSIATALAQPLESAYSIQNFTDEHGLPQNSVKSINADKTGFIWLNTQSGLARFDGRNIVNFAKVHNGVGEVKFYDVIPDPYGNSGTFYATKFNSPSIRIRDAVASFDSTFDYAKLQARLSLKDDSHSLIESHAPGVVNQDMPRYVEELFLPVIGREGCFYKINRQHILFFDKWQHRWTAKNPFSVLSRFFIRGTTLYHLNNASELVAFENRRWTPVTLTGDISIDLNKSVSHQLFWNLLSNQVFLLVADRFYHVHPGKNNVWTTSLLLEGFSFESNHIRSAFYEERSGSLLLGSATRGLFLVKKNSFTTIRNSRDDMENVFYAQIGLDENRILLPNGKIEGIAREASRITTSSSETTQRSRLPATEMRYMLRDRSGRIWFSRRDSIICQSSTGEKQLSANRFQAPVSCLFELPEGGVVVGLKKHDFYKIASPGARPVFFAQAPDSTDGTYALRTDSESVWLGTDKGLYLLSLKTKKMRVLPGTSKYYIRSIFQAATPGSVFFTTFDAGLFYWNGEKVIHFPGDTRGYLNSAHCIFEDKRGYLWITTNKGLFQMHIEDLYRYAGDVDRKGSGSDLFYLYYNKNDGFGSNEFNGGCQPCALRLQNGFVSLPSISGLVLFEPERLNLHLPDRPLIIDRVEEGSSVRMISGDTVQLAANPRNVSFFLGTPYFGNIENLHFSYAMMRNGEKPGTTDWISVPGNDLSIRFSELVSGKHKLWVRKANGFGRDNFTVSIVEVFVPLNWYEMLWFKTLVVFILTGGIYLIFHIRTRNLRRRNLQLEDKVAERTQSLQDTLVSLKTSEKELSRQMQLQSRLIASISHDVCTPINYFANAADMAEGIIKGEENDDARQLMKELGRSARHIYSFVDNLVNFSKSQIYGLHTSVRPIGIHQLLEEKVQIFKAVLTQRNVTFENNLPAGKEVVSSPQLLGIIIHNMLDNAIKHSYRNTIVRVTGETRPDGYHLIFSNSGKEVPEEIINWLNIARGQDDVRTVPQDYRGLGLLIVKETAAILEIGILAENGDTASIHLIFH